MPMSLRSSQKGTKNVAGHRGVKLVFSDWPLTENLISIVSFTEQDIMALLAATGTVTGNQEGRETLS